MNTTQSPAGIEKAIMTFVRELGNISPGDPEFSADVDLYDTGYLDSLGVVALTTFLEAAYGVTLSEQELFDPRMTTVAGIAEIVCNRDAGSRPDGTSVQ
jgi:acyl carrier protein